MTVDVLHGVIGLEGVEAVEGEETLEAIELITTDGEGWPHVAWLSAGELLPVDPSTIAACLWPRSTSSANLLRDGRALLQVVVGGNVVKLRLDARPLGSIEAGGQQFAAFALTVRDREGDAVSYADVLSGPRYRLTDPASVTARWREQLAALAEIT